MADRFDLGKLLENVPDLGTKREQIEYIRLELIDDDAKNFYATDEIESLARNIATVGLLDPLRIRDDPDSEGRYKLVSGHRRRLALNLLVQDDPERWGEVACIHDQMAFSPTMQQLRLIFANSDNRKKSDADISEEAVQTEQLLYKLAEEEGYEFPGRMRDHVAKIVGVSKSKLARLKVIREKLAENWQPDFKKGKLNESVAYELAQMPKAHQSIIFHVRGSGGYLDAKYVKLYRERFEKIEALKCKKFDRETCHNAGRKQSFIASSAPYGSFYCDKCCDKCPDITTCKWVCPSLATKAAQLRADKRAARKQELAAEREAEQPKTDKVASIWYRFGLERSIAGCSVKDVKDAMGDYCFSDDPQKYGAFESGAKKVTSGSKLPFGMYLHDVSKLIAVADLFKCSLDYLLCRTDIKELAQTGRAVPEQDTQIKEPEYIPGAWYPVSVEPPVGMPLILIDSGGYADTGMYKGCGEYTMDYGDPVTLWTLEPKETDVVANTPVSELGAGWQTGTPEAYGTYVAYVQITGSDKKSLRELLWDEEEWFLFGQSIADTAKVCCWMERPEDV